MGCCGKNEEDKDACADTTTPEMEELCKLEQGKSKNKNIPYTWHPTVSNVQQIAYVRRLERQHEALQSSFFNLSSEMARLQFRIRQLIQAAPCERQKLIDDLEHAVFKEIDAKSRCRAHELPLLEQHNLEMGDIKKKQHLFIWNLRQQIGSFQQATECLTTEYKYQDKGWEKEQERKCGPAVQVSLPTKPSSISQGKSELASKASETKLRKSGGSDYFMNSATGSTETCSSLGHQQSSVRSTSFKELRDMYQRGCEKSA